MDFLNEDNYTTVINEYSPTDWQPLFDLIPSIERTTHFREEGLIAGTYIDTPIIHQFCQIVYDMPIIVVFDWGEWDEGSAMVNDKNFDFTSIDIPTKCKLITAFIRNDRFAEGVLANSFESGTMLKILKAIKAQVS